MTGQTLFGGPYAHEKASVSRTMLLVVLTLVPATVFGLYMFGWPAIILFVLTIGSAVAAESASLRVMGKAQKPFLLDGSALLTGWLLAMTLPPWAPWWIGVIGASLAIVIGKQAFGGIGQNLFNPAMVARVALLISFPLEMTLFSSPQPLSSAHSPDFLEGIAIIFGNSPQIDAVSSATPLGHVKTELGRGIPLHQALAGTSDLWNIMSGTTAGSMGETSALLLIPGGLLLIYKRIITWHIPVAMLGTLSLLAGTMHLVDPATYSSPLFHLFAGSAILGAFFIATDLVTSPVSTPGKLLFGAGCGALVYVIRTFAGYPEGVAFAVLLMNACTPLIDHYLKPRIYGRSRRGKPLNYSDRKGES